MRVLLSVLVAILILPAALVAETVSIETPMEPPYWALLQRELLRANADAVEQWAGRYLDDRGYLRVTPRWGRWSQT